MAAGDTPGARVHIPVNSTKSSVTVVIPTYREADSIPHLLTRLKNVREKSGLNIDVLLMDDDSQDGSEQLVERLAYPWARMITRRTNRGLSYAVLDGLRLSDGEILVVMDADLSHPPERIPDMVAVLGDGFEIVTGSRFVEGGSTADDWGLFRWLNSRVASLLAMPLTTLSDPMSGFFVLRRSTFLAGRDFNPVGYKILLEIIIKCRCRRILEIPIHFDNRRFGESKLSFKEQLKFIQHLRRLYIYKYGTWSHLVQFLVVGLSGVVVNLAVLTLLLRLGFGARQCVVLAIVTSMLWNFALNRRFSFSYARDQSVVRQLVGFAAACSVGAVVNYFTAVSLWEKLPYKQLAALIGAVAGTLFNFVANRYWVFRSKYIQPRR
jgi:dolichol-phosphate mannosyltransferase